MLLVARENSGNMNLSSDSSTIYVPLSHSYLYIYSCISIIQRSTVWYFKAECYRSRTGGVRESLFYKWFSLQAMKHSNKSLKLFDL